MKGFVFTVPKNKQLLRLPDIRRHGHDLRQLLSRYGLQAVFVALFLLGLVIGAAASRSFDRETFDKLDLLFVTNLDARREMSAFGIFLSCFVSYFIFVFCVFLAGLSVWGFAGVPLLSAFKGFTVGLSSAFIFSLYRLSGIGFYILVILPGTVLFLFILIRYSAHGFRLSIRYMRLSMFGAEKEPELSLYIRRFLKQTLFAFLSVSACAVTDLILWLLFANQFEFS